MLLEMMIGYTDEIFDAMSKNLLILNLLNMNETELAYYQVYILLYATSNNIQCLQNCVTVAIPLAQSVSQT